MKLHLLKCSVVLLAVLALASCSDNKQVAWESSEADGTLPSIIPLPDSLSFGDHAFEIPGESRICYNDGGETAAEWLSELLENVGLDVSKKQGDACGDWNIILDPQLKSQLGDEGYILDVSFKGVQLESASKTGLFYAIQSLRQFFPAEIEQQDFSGENLTLRESRIVDSPRYGWRGSMVDVARSFFGLDYLKHHVDRMAAYKLNRLHLHLSDDQGWRIELKSKPKLTEVGSKSSVKNGNSGFLTQEDYKELQDYAAARHIVIIPEIDMPGHIYAALVSYPELNCDDLSNLDPKLAIPPDFYNEYRVGWSKFCFDKPETYEFVSDVIQELAEITQGPWIHIGGDEIKDPHYKEFVVKADSIVRSYGKNTIGWEEVTQAEVDSNFISQQWNGQTKSVVETQIIESICSNFYLDHGNVPGQEKTNNWCKEDGVSIEDVYSFNRDDAHVIGVEAAVWTEFVLNDQMLDNRFWPRLIAVSEVGWTKAGNRDFEDFMERLNGQSERLNQMGIHYFATPEIDWGSGEIAATPKTVFSGFVPKKIQNK